MTLFLRAEDVDPEQVWELLAWCAAHGGSEFSLRQMCVGGEPPPQAVAADAVLAPFRLPAAVRPRSVVYVGQPAGELEDLWALTPASITVLRGLFPDGLLAAPSYDRGGWLEDPTVYRGTALLLGVVSHEGYAFLDLCQAEQSQVEDLGIRLRVSVP